MKCDICNEYEGEERSVKMHRIHCAKKAAKETVVEEQPQVVAEPTIVETRQREEPNRADRVPFGTPERKLQQRNQEDGYTYYTFNDNWAKEPSRIQRAEMAGYEKTGKPAVTVGTNEDGSPIKGVEMRIPTELYEADQKAKQKEIDLVDEAIRGGKLEEKEGDNRYIPDGIKMWSD